MSYTVKEGAPLQQFLLEKMSGISKTKSKQLLANGAVTVNGKICTKYDYLLKVGDSVNIQSKNHRANSPRNCPLEIAYEDDYIVVINKPQGLLSVATATGGSNPQGEITAHSIMNEYVKDNPEYVKRNKFAEQARIFIVHRLDRETSGLMIFAKDEKTKELLQHNWENIITDRRYVAVAEGIIGSNRQSNFGADGTIISWLKDNKAFVTYSSWVDNGGQKAITQYKTLMNNAHSTLVELTLETGRKNQIRVHLQEIGHPIVGDKKYGGKSAERLFLHAYRLSFIHPHTGKQYSFSSKIPGNFKKFFNVR